MKPTKNHVYCPASHKPKIMFATQKKADNFIKFNHDAILEESGIAPVRSYYCAVCCCWHVTSNPSQEAAERMDRRDQKKLSGIYESKSAEKVMNEHLLSMRQVQKQIESALEEGNEDLAWEKLREMRKLRDTMQRTSIKVLTNKITKKMREASEIYDRMYFILKYERRLAQYTDEQLQHLIDKPNKNKHEQQLAEIAEKQAQRRQQELMDKCAKLIVDNNNNFYSKLETGRVDEAEDTLNSMMGILKQLHKLGYQGDNLERIEAICARNQHWAKIARAVADRDDATIDAMGLEKDEMERVERWRNTYASLAQINELMGGIDAIEDIDELMDTIKVCRDTIKLLRKYIGKKFFKEYNMKLDQLTKESKDKQTETNDKQKKIQTTILLEIIGKIETMEVAFSHGDVSTCKKHYGECWNLIDLLDHSDEDARTVEMYVESWHDRLAAS